MQNYPACKEFITNILSASVVIGVSSINTLSTCEFRYTGILTPYVYILDIHVTITDAWIEQSFSYT